LVVHFFSFLVFFTVLYSISDAAGEVAAAFWAEHLPAGIQEEKSKKEHLSWLVAWKR
jgi:hypothetical protein